MKSQNEADILLCKTMTKQYGTSYFLSTYFFPKKIRERTWILYAFLRYPDELVDNPTDTTVSPEIKLAEWRASWQRAYAGDTDIHPILRANAVLFKECNIPFEYSEIFLERMLQDTHTNRYNTYQELEDYMYGSATVVGYMMCHIIGFESGALPYAKALGEAFQMTNFLRDIKEDLGRDRIYIPIVDMESYQVSETDLKSATMNNHVRELIKFEIERTETLYQDAKKGIALLDPTGRRAVRIALYLYKRILDKIKKNPHSIFKKRVRVSWYEKLYIIIKHL